MATLGMKWCCSEHYLVLKEHCYSALAPNSTRSMLGHAVEIPHQSRSLFVLTQGVDQVLSQWRAPILLDSTSERDRQSGVAVALVTYLEVLYPHKI